MHQDELGVVPHMHGNLWMSSFGTILQILIRMLLEEVIPVLVREGQFRNSTRKWSEWNKFGETNGWRRRSQRLFWWVKKRNKLPLQLVERKQKNKERKHLELQLAEKESIWHLQRGWEGKHLAASNGGEKQKVEEYKSCHFAAREGGRPRQRLLCSTESKQTSRRGPCCLLAAPKRKN